MKKPQIISAGIIPIQFHQGTPTFLLLRAYKYWDFPKGVLEEGESPIQGALRELQEETGISDVTFPWGQNFYQTEIYANNKSAKYFVARTQTAKVRLTKNPKTGILEHHEFKWCSYDEASELVGPRVLNALKWAAAQIKTKS